MVAECGEFLAKTLGNHKWVQQFRHTKCGVPESLYGWMGSVEQ